MKKAVLVSFMGLFCGVAFGQEDAVQKAMREQAVKDKEKSDKSIEDPKANIKASTWLSRAKTYEGIAQEGKQPLDSSAALVALEAYKKVIELDKTKKGEAGKDAKAAEDILAGKEASSLYNAFINQAVLKYQNKNLNGAYEFFDKAVGLYQKDTTAALYGGIAAQQLGKLPEAGKLWEKYTANGGKDPSIFYSLSEVYKTQKQFDKSLEVINKGIALNPTNKDLKAEIVNIHIASGNEDKAINELTKLVDQDPKNVTNAMNLGIMYDNVAGKAGSKIRQLEDKLASSGSKKAKLEKQLSDEQGKLDAFNAEAKRLGGLIAKKPKNLADLNRQLAQVNEGKTASAAEIAKIKESISAADAAAAGVDKASVEKELGELKAKQNEDKAKAAAIYNKVLEIDPNNYDALYSVGVVYFNEAVELKREVDNMSVQEYQQRGKALEGKVCGRFKKAKPYFEKAVAARADGDAKDTLETLNTVLKEFENKSVPCTE